MLVFVRACRNVFMCVFLTRVPLLLKSQWCSSIVFRIYNPLSLAIWKNSRLGLRTCNLSLVREKWTSNWFKLLELVCISGGEVQSQLQPPPTWVNSKALHGPGKTDPMCLLSLPTPNDLKWPAGSGSLIFSWLSSSPSHSRELHGWFFALTEAFVWIFY
jgi:hypothetical protein